MYPEIKGLDSSYGETDLTGEIAVCRQLIAEYQREYDRLKELYEAVINPAPTAAITLPPSLRKKTAKRNEIKRISDDLIKAEKNAIGMLELVAKLAITQAKIVIDEDKEEAPMPPCIFTFEDVR